MNAELEIIKNPSTLTEWLEKNKGWLQERQNNAVAALNSLKEPTNDDEYEYNSQMLSRVKDTYDITKAKRMEATKMLDDIKDHLMSFERPMDYNTKADSLYNDKRSLQEKYMMKKLAEKKEAEKKAAHLRAVEDHKVDLITTIKSKLSSMLTEKERGLDNWVLTFFKPATSKNFDEYEKRFKSANPKLQEKDYLSCFNVPVNTGLINADEFSKLIDGLKTEEPYQKWAEELLSRIMPSINAWRAKIHEIKEDIIARENASSEEERKRIEKEQNKKQEDEIKKRQEEIDRQAKAEAERIQQEAEINKMRNSFQEQGINQEIDSVPTKKVLTFMRPKAPSALVGMIYVIFDNPKFAGIQKTDKNGGPLFDDNGRPVYIPAVQWWVDFFLKNCDLNKYKIPETLVDDIAKVTIRR